MISGIANEFKRFNISMKSMLQKDDDRNSEKFATIVITTHNCDEKNMTLALSSINKMNFIKQKVVYYRIEDFTT